MGKMYAKTHIENAVMPKTAYGTVRHVHALHPYPGMMRPQIVKHLLSTYLGEAHCIFDPFAGSGTTLVEASEMGFNAIGVDVCEFSCVICRAKTEEYDTKLLKKEIFDMFNNVTQFLPETNVQTKESASTLTSADAASEVLQAARFCEGSISKYNYQNALRTILSRAIYPFNHNGWDNNAPQLFVKRLQLSSKDVLRRIQDFSKVRSNHSINVVRGDSRIVNLKELACDHKQKPDFVLTSPPYLGRMNYHDLFSYAYDLFEIPRHDKEEIGSRSLDTGFPARRKYVEDMVASFSNIRENVRPGAQLVVVVEDRFGLYPEIIKEAKLQVNILSGVGLQPGERVLLLSYK
jgi:site-specific DNA-adenine methylase